MNEEEPHEIFNRTDPHSVIQMVTNRFAEAMLSIPEDILSLSETDLVEKYFNSATGVPVVLAKLRVAFWKEYDYQLKKKFGGRIVIAKLVCGICGDRAFFKEVLDKPHALAFLLMRPAEYWNAIEEISQICLPEMRRIMLMREMINEKTGTPDYKLLDLKFKIFQYIDARIHGGFTQKVENKNLNVNVEATPEQLEQFKSVEEIDKRLAELERDKAQEALPPGEPPLEILPVQRVVQEAGRVTDMRYKE